MHEAATRANVFDRFDDDDGASRQPRLDRCRALLKELDPRRPPPHVQPKEFRWQYRALRERVHVYAQRLADSSGHYPDPALMKAEFAIGLSLRYFHDILSTKRECDDEVEGNA